MRIVIAGVSSGAGKTSITAGIIGALRRRGMRVQPFKAGPDYIDPGYHAAAAGVPCRNLDTWMLDEGALRELFQHATASVDIAVVEGVMGLYDGKSGLDGAGSTAALAKLLDAPVLLVVDVQGMARSAGALVLGYQRFDPDVRLAGVLLNNAGGAVHASMAREAVEHATGLPVLGYLPRRPDLELPERHLGLVPVVERRVAVADVLSKLSEQIAASCDLEGIVRMAGTCSPLPRPSRRLFPDQPPASQGAIGVAADEAFSFYYQDNLDLLAAWGARLVPFSPLRDHALPEGVGALYIGGGFPEVYAEQLAANKAMRAAIADAIATGMPVYAECGGLMYLGEDIQDFDARRHEMVGVLRFASAMPERRMTLGYRTARAQRDSFLLRAGEVVRGHEFHWSVLDQPVDASDAAYTLLPDDEAQGQGRPEGFVRGNLLASYVHLHFGSKPELAARFVAASASWLGGSS